MYSVKEKCFDICEKAVRCLFPKRCPVCDNLIPLNEDYCACLNQQSVKISEDFCRHCGAQRDKCSCKSPNSVYLPEITAVYIYGGRIRADILNLKFGNEKRLALKLGTAMAERCANVYSSTDFDIVSFVPMTKKALTKRTYNQSQLLARQVGKMLLVPVEELFVKTRNTKAQHGLGGNERLENVKNSVILTQGADVKGKSILICDDVKTTGATLNQCVQALKAGGAEKICCVCAAIADFS